MKDKACQFHLINCIEWILLGKNIKWTYLFSQSDVKPVKKANNTLAHSYLFYLNIRDINTTPPSRVECPVFPWGHRLRCGWTRTPAWPPGTCWPPRPPPASARSPSDRAGPGQSWSPSQSYLREKISFILFIKIMLTFIAMKSKNIYWIHMKHIIL